MRNVLFAGTIIAAATCVQGRQLVDEGARQLFSRPPSDLTPTASVSVRVADPMGIADFARICTVLSLSPPQEMLARDAFQRYQQSTDVLVEGNVRALWQVSFSAGEALAIRPNYANYKILRESLSSREDALARQLRGIDQGFFDAVESFLAEEQKPALDRVKLRRARQHCATDESRIGAVMDLSILMEMPEAVLPEELAGLEELVSSYERQATPLLVTLDKELRNCRLRSAEVFAQQELARDSGDQATVVALQQVQQAAYQEAATIQRRLVELNDRFAKQMALTLEERRGREFLQFYHAYAYSRIFPDVLNAQAIFDRCASADLNAHQREAIQAIRVDFMAKHESIDNKLIAGLNDLDEHMARHFQHAPDRKEWLRMRELRQQRWDLDIATVMQVRDTLALVGDSPLAESIQEYLALAKQVIHAAESDKFPY